MLGSSVLSTSDDIEQAAFSAVLLAELHGTPLELSSDVQAEVLERAHQRRAKLEAARKANELALEIERVRRT